MKCLLCNNHETKEIYTYRIPQHYQENRKFFPNIKIQTCQECKISYCSNTERSNLDNYYKSIYEDKPKIKNRFKEFNSRFFSQILFYINHVRIHENIKVLEVGPNILGILPTLKIFQKKVSYYYYDQVVIKHNHKEIFKLGDYFDPLKSELPKVDLIWMSHCLEHIFPSDLKDMLNAYYKALNKGGKIFVEIPNDMMSKNFKIPHTLFFEKEGVIKLFEKFNFKIIAFSEINHPSDKTEKNTISEVNFTKDKSFLVKFYLLIQKFLPDYLVKKFAFKNFVLNGPYTNKVFIRFIAEKIDK